MPHFTIRLCVLALMAAAAITPGAHADVPRLLAWQGVALDSTNVPVTDSTYGFTFRIYNDDFGGTLLWSESQLVTTENGVLNVLLGTTNPIPDSVFAGPDRYLEVQFATEPPYSPRTRIVSVAYAYRAGTVDGATGGTVTGNLKLTPDSSVAGLYLLRPFSINNAVQILSTANGGNVYVCDGTGVSHTSLQTDPNDGVGGRLSIFDDHSFTHGFTVWDPVPALSAASLKMSLVGDSSSMVLNSGAQEDNAVQLPPNAVNASEIRAEAGVVSGPRSSASLSTTYATVASATLNAPDSGYVVVISQATLRNHTENNYLSCWLYINSTASTSWYWDAGDVDSPTVWYDLTQQYVYTGRVGPESYTYELQVRTSAGTAYADNAKVVAMYFPTAYGALNQPVAASSSWDSDLRQSGAPYSPSVDVEMERQESIRFDRLRIERELTEMKERMARLEEELRQTAADSPEMR